MNTTGATVTVDVGIQDYTDRIQFAAPGSQSPVSDFTEYNFTVGSYMLLYRAHNGTNYQVDEQVTISGAGLTGTNTAKVCHGMLLT